MHQTLLTIVIIWQFSLSKTKSKWNEETKTTTFGHRKSVKATPYYVGCIRRSVPPFTYKCQYYINQPVIANTLISTSYIRWNQLPARARVVAYTRVKQPQSPQLVCWVQVQLYTTLSHCQLADVLCIALSQMMNLLWSGACKHTCSQHIHCEPKKRWQHICDHYSGKTRLIFIIFAQL